mgnify:CR=1 FL=1
MPVERSIHGSGAWGKRARAAEAALLELTPSGDGIAARQVYFTREMQNHPGVIEAYLGSADIAEKLREGQ